MTGPHWHEHNPWKDELLYITLDEAQSLMLADDRLERYTKQYGDKVDAYILPSGSVGIRYGVEGSDYLSPFVHPLAAIRFLFDRLVAARDDIETLEGLRPHWSLGFSSDSIAAQVTSAALQQLWTLLGAPTQTAAVRKVKELLK